LKLKNIVHLHAETTDGVKVIIKARWDQIAARVDLSKVTVETVCK
jgi:hypothetical protein